MDLNVSPGELTASAAEKLREDSRTLEQMRRESEQGTTELKPEFVLARLTGRDATTGWYSWTEDAPAQDVGTNFRYSKPNGLSGSVTPTIWNPAVVQNGETITCSVASPYKCHLRRITNTVTYGTIWEVIAPRPATTSSFIGSITGTTAGIFTSLNMGSVALPSSGEYIVLGFVRNDAFTGSASVATTLQNWLTTDSVIGVTINPGDGNVAPGPYMYFDAQNISGVPNNGVVYAVNNIASRVSIPVGMALSLQGTHFISGSPSSDNTYWYLNVWKLSD